MTQEEKIYTQIGKAMKDVVISQMFGKPCLKVNGKAFACFSENEMVFKLPKDSVQELLKLEGARLFDPSGKNRPMKEWVQLSRVYAGKWEHYTKIAFDYEK